MVQYLYNRGANMVVYRLCSKDEIDKIFANSSFLNVGVLGKEFHKENDEVDLNSHNYVENELYMHFFPKFIDLFYLGLEEGMYICFYDVPFDILKENVGYGEYVDFFTYKIPRKIEEFAIESKKIDFDYLLRVDKINSNINIEDYFADETLNGFCETIYKKNITKSK